MTILYIIYIGKCFRRCLRHHSCRSVQNKGNVNIYTSNKPTGIVILICFGGGAVAVQQPKCITSSLHHLHYIYIQHSSDKCRDSFEVKEALELGSESRRCSKTGFKISFLNWMPVGVDREHCAEKDEVTQVKNHIRNK